MQAPRRGVLDDFRLCQRLDLRAKLNRLRIPTLIIGGTDDLLVSPEQLTETQQAIPGAELTLIPSAGHLVMLEQPTAFVNRLKQFLAAVP